MSEGGQSNRIETILYDADGNRTDDESVAVRAEVVGGELATRPSDEQT
jgi:hypothetical protein